MRRVGDHGTPIEVGPRRLTGVTLYDVVLACDAPSLVAVDGDAYGPCTLRLTGGARELADLTLYDCWLTITRMTVHAGAVTLDEVTAHGSPVPPADVAHAAALARLAYDRASLSLPTHESNGPCHGPRWAELSESERAGWCVRAASLLTKPARLASYVQHGVVTHAFDDALYALAPGAPGFTHLQEQPVNHTLAVPDDHLTLHVGYSDGPLHACGVARRLDTHQTWVDAYPGQGHVPRCTWTLTGVLWNATLRDAGPFTLQVSAGRLITVLEGVRLTCREVGKAPSFEGVSWFETIGGTFEKASFTQ